MTSRVILDKLPGVVLTNGGSSNNNGEIFCMQLDISLAYCLRVCVSIRPLTQKSEKKDKINYIISESNKHIHR